MTDQETFSEYSRRRLGGRPVPDDLGALLKMQWQRPASSGNDEQEPDPLALIDAHLLEADESHNLLDHSYLRPKDLQNPDIVANVEAIKAVCRHAAFVAVDSSGSLFGYWFGPEQLPIDAAPLIRLSTDGCFSLVTGRTLAESLLGYSFYSEGEDYTTVRRWFAKFGVIIEPACWDDVAAHTSPTHPDELHQQLYNEGRVARGLPPIKG